MVFPTQSVLLDGTSQTLTAADSASLSPTGNQTHEGYLKFTSVPSSGASMCIFDKYGPTGNQRGLSVVYENSAGTLQFTVRTSSDGVSALFGSLPYTITAGAWNHYRFVYSTAGTVQIYVNNVSIGTVSSLSTSIFDNSATYKLGFNVDIGGRYAGRIGLWRVWNTTHTTSDLCTVYGTTTANLAAEWSLDNVLTDASGSSNTLTNVGSATFAADVTSSCAVPVANMLACLGCG